MSKSPDDDHELRIATDSLLLGCLLTTIGIKDWEMLQDFVTLVTKTLADESASPDLTKSVDARLAPYREKFRVK